MSDDPGPPISQRLCIFCRQLEDITSECPTTKQLESPTNSFSIKNPTSLQPNTITPLPEHDELLLNQLQQVHYPSRSHNDLCPRCKEYDIIRVFREADPLDPRQQTMRFGASVTENPLHDELHAAYQRQLSTYEIRPRPTLSSLLLTPSCPLCRLIYRILPRENLDPNDTMFKLTPFRSTIRLLLTLPPRKDGSSSNALFLGLGLPNLFGPLSMQGAMGDEYSAGAGESTWGFDGPATVSSEAIVISPSCAFPGRKENNFRFISPFIDWDLLGAALDSCTAVTGHDVSCFVGGEDQPFELRSASMIDVFERKIVPCPVDCEYFALSYVWGGGGGGGGGVLPTVEDLENGTLPQTIEDAIVVTRKLGKRYLWVDALCIIQLPDDRLTPEQKRLKAQQLGMMDLIYGCAALTLVAMSGSDSNAGLSGVSRPRTSQLKEIICDQDGKEYEFYTIPPSPLAERENSLWESRAWTLQENLLSRRKLFFTETQMYFMCQRQGILECFMQPGEWDENEEMDCEGELRHYIEAMGDDFPGGSLDVARTGGLGRLRGIKTTKKDEGSESAEGEEPKLDPDDWFMYGFLGLLTGYTSRKMTHPSDSLNALLGVLKAWERNLLPGGHKFAWGLPLTLAPQFLGWMHDKRVGREPPRRHDFPSWSWAGWEGEVTVDNLLPVGLIPPDRQRRIGDLTVRIVGVEGKRLTVEGWVVSLNVRTEPFSEVVVVDTSENDEDGEMEQREEKVIGSVKERNFVHNNTLATGVYECLVVERIRGEILDPATGRERVRVFMVVLEPYTGPDDLGGVGSGNADSEGVDSGVLVRQRKTMITLTLFAGGEFESTSPTKRVVTLL